MLIKANGLDRSVLQQSFDVKTVISKEYLHKIVKCKKQFFEKGMDPRKNSFIRQEIAESWVRTLNSGKSPQSLYLTCKLENSESKFKKIWTENQLLINAAAPLINNFLELSAAEGYALSLFDKNGVFLIGTHLKIFSNPPAVDMGWNENTAGTTANWLATIYKKTFMLIGPEHYLEILSNILAYSAPILDEKGEVLGTIALTKKLSEHFSEESIHNLSLHSFAWVNSLATAIESQIKYLIKNNLLSSVTDDLTQTKQIFNALLETSKEVIVTVDSAGTILGINQLGRQLFGLNYETIEQRNIKEFINNLSCIEKTLGQKSLVGAVERYIKLNRNKKVYRVLIEPLFKNEKEEKRSVFILKIKEPEKANVKINHYSSSRDRLKGNEPASFSFEDIIGKSPVMQKTIIQARRFAEGGDNILLLGESGTGKELFAQAIHNHYNSNGQLMAVNCAAMPESLIESELFGYESGAFTGAKKDGRPGKIELANNGTLFLDEIGDMPYQLQATLLRVLQNKQIMRLGGNDYRKINFRLIAATNKNLWKLVQEKYFREDLYFRLSVLTVEIPPLRKRGYDIVILAEHFLKIYAHLRGWSPPKLTEKALCRILEYNWPGNVRQLENAMIYAINLAEEGVIDLNHLPKEIGAESEESLVVFDKNGPNNSDEDQERFLSLKDSEKIVLQNAMRRSGENVALAAKLLNVSKATLYRKLKEHGIEY